MSAIAAPRKSLSPLSAPLVSIRALLRESQNGLSKRQSDSGEPVPVLRLANVVDGAIDESDAREIRLTEKEIAKYALELDDLLCIRVNGSRNLVGRLVPFIARRRWAYCDHFIRLRPDRTRVDSRYLAHYLDTRVARRQIELNMVSSAGQNTVSQATMLDLLVPLPDLDRQRAIVAEVEKQFSRLDEAVVNLKRVKANLNSYKAAVVRAAVDGRLVPTEAELARREERAYESGPELIGRILRSGNSKTGGAANAHEQVEPAGTYLPALPEGWGWAACDELLAGIEAGASFKCVERPPLLGEIGVLKVSAISWGQFNEEESKTCVDPGRVRDEFLVKPGDFLFSRANTIDLVGACVIVRSVTKRLMLSDKTLRFRPRPFVLPEWLLACLRSEHGRGEITRLATGNQESMRNIGQDRIRRIRIPIPPLAEQRRIVAELDCRLSTIDSVGQTVNDSFTRVQHLTQAVLADQFEAVAEEVA